MAEKPEPLTEDKLDGTERIRVARRMKDADGNRTGPVKVWTTAVSDILQFARRVSPTVKAIVLGPSGALSYETTDGLTKSLGSLTGPQGATGATGSQGPKGDAGVQGQQGPKGDAGVAGPKGDAGTPGAAGAAGPKGDTGSVGPTGATGAVGPAGATGVKGPAGTPKRIERYTAATNASGVATFTWSPAFTAAPDVQVIDGWSGDQMLTGGVATATLTGATVNVKRTRATLLLSAGPFETAPSGVSITVRAMGN